MISNNFVELKGSVFKKFEINNLFQMTCSGTYALYNVLMVNICSFLDVRERFHYVIFMLVIVIRNLSQSEDLCELIKKYCYVLYIVQSAFVRMVDY